MDEFVFNRYPNIAGLIDRIKAVSKQYKLSIRHELVNDGEELDEWVNAVVLEVPHLQPVRVILTGSVSEAIESAVDKLEVLDKVELYKVARYDIVSNDDTDDDDVYDDNEDDYSDDDEEDILEEESLCCAVTRQIKPEATTCPVCGGAIER